jgi:hypothetical protein
MLTICIGYDPAETVAYHVLCHSILSRSSQPVRFIPINKAKTPFLCGYQGQAIFMDCDMLVLCDIAEILDECSLAVDVSVVQHDYEPKTKTKFLGATQHVYPKKNWSSVMVFNNYMQSCRRLTPEIVNKQSGKFLHQFEWTDRVGSLPVEWNHLVGECSPNPKAKIVHFTLGTPCFHGFEDQEYSQEWFEERSRMLAHD